MLHRRDSVHAWVFVFLTVYWKNETTIMEKIKGTCTKHQSRFPQTQCFPTFFWIPWKTPRDLKFWAIEKYKPHWRGSHKVRELSKSESRWLYEFCASRIKYWIWFELLHIQFLEIILQERGGHISWQKLFYFFQDSHLSHCLFNIL